MEKEVATETVKKLPERKGENWENSGMEIVLPKVHQFQVLQRVNAGQGPEAFYGICQRRDQISHRGMVGSET